MTPIGKAILLFSLCAGGVFAAENSTVVTVGRAETVITPELLTNEGIVALANAGFSDAFIVEKILLSDRTRLDVSVEGLAYLRRNAISERLALFIIEHSAQPLIPPAAPLMPAVAAKTKMKKVQVPADAINVTFERATVVPAATVTNPVVAQPRLYSNGYGYAPYSYAVQTAPAAARHWWR